MNDATYPATKLNVTDTWEVRDLVSASAFDGDGDMRYAGGPEAIRHDNTRRAGFAAEALVAYAERTGVINEDIETAFSDMLGDLHHLADALGVDFEALNGRGVYHYVPELKGEL